MIEGKLHPKLAHGEGQRVIIGYFCDVKACDQWCSALIIARGFMYINALVANLRDMLSKLAGDMGGVVDHEGDQVFGCSIILIC